MTVKAGYLVIVAIVFLVIGLAIGYAVKPSTNTPPVTTTVTVTKTAAPSAATTVTVTTETVTATPSTAKPSGLAGEIPIGIALPESGSFASVGKEQIKAAEIAIDEINELLAKVGAPFKFKPIVVDTRTSAQGGREAVETLINVYGCQVIVGTATSLCLKQAMQYAIEKGVPMISPSSTSQLLAKPDIIFRVIGTDICRGKALASLLWHYGFKKAAVIFRDDAYGRGVAEAFKKFFTEKGGKVEMVSYSPEQVPGPEVINTLAEKVSALGADEETAVLVVAFEDDGKAIFKYAMGNDVLSKVRWFSADGVRGSALLPPNIPEDMAEWLVKVKFTGVAECIPDSPLTKEFIEKYKELYGHEPVSVYSIYAYDAAYIACLAVIMAGKYEGKAIAEMIPEVAKHYYGVTGWKILDENGDAMFQDYSIWVYKKTPEGYKFVDIGIYHSVSDSITMTG